MLFGHLNLGLRLYSLVHLCTLCNSKIFFLLFISKFLYIYGTVSQSHSLPIQIERAYSRSPISNGRTISINSPNLRVLYFNSKDRTFGKVRTFQNDRYKKACSFAPLWRQSISRLLIVCVGLEFIVCSPILVVHCSLQHTSWQSTKTETNIPLCWRVKSIV